MPAIVAIRNLLSLHATTQLVHADWVAQWGAPGTTSLTIVDATNTSPIVVTTLTDHGFRPTTIAHVVIRGVEGNTAANNLDESPAQQSSTSGMNCAWYAVSTGARTFALYSLDRTGALVASTGNGAYTSGGTASKAFLDGLMLLGRRWIYAASFPPRVVLIPTSSAFDSKATANPVIDAAERQRMRAARSLRTDVKRFEVHVWGVGQMGAPTRDPDTDYTATEVLYEQVIRSAHLLGAGIYDLDAGQWADDAEGETQVQKAGHEYVFGLSFQSPITDRALEQAPNDVAPDWTTTLQPADGSPPEVSCGTGV